MEEGTGQKPREGFRRQGQRERKKDNRQGKGAEEGEKGGLTFLHL